MMSVKLLEGTSLCAVQAEDRALKYLCLGQ